MAAELQVMIDAEVTGLGTELSARNKKIDAETPVQVIRTMPQNIDAEVNLSVFTNITTSLLMGVYVKAVASTFYAGNVAAGGTVSLCGARIDEGEAMFIPSNSLTVGATYPFALLASAASSAEIVAVYRD